MPVPAFLLFAVASTLTPAQQHMLERDFACPAHLPDDDARIEAVKRFMMRYSAFSPHSTVSERMAFRGSLLAKKKCVAPDPDLQFTFPES